MHLAPMVFGDTSPKLELANAATNGPCWATIQLVQLLENKSENGTDFARHSFRSVDGLFEK